MMNPKEMNVDFSSNDGFSTMSMADRFSLVRALSDQMEVGGALLPEEIFLGVKDKEESERLHVVATHLWKDVFKEGEFVETLTQIVQHTDAYTPEVNQKLRLSRIGGLILRDANRLFSETHLNPEAFYRFMKILGAFNDNYGKKTVEPTVDDVLIAMRTSQEEKTDEFVPCSPESFEEYLKKEVDLITTYLHQQVLSAEVLHDLRRTNRRFLNLFLLKTISEGDRESFGIYAYLRQVNTCLGDCLDENNNKEAGEPVGPVEIPAVAIELIRKFLERIRW